jgi:hypothetical protein
MPSYPFFGSGPTQDETATPPCPPGLPERMRGLHTRMIQVFQLALDHHKRARYDNCVSELGEFDRLLRSYLGNEEAELEDYLNTRLAGDSQHLLAMRQVRARLRQLARQVHEMLQPPHPSRQNPARSRGHELFIENLRKTLVQCVDMSEMELLPQCRPALPRTHAPATTRAQPATTEAALPTVGSIWRKASMR